MTDINIKKHNSVKVMNAPTYLVQYTDGKGQTETKLALIVGDDIRFLNNDALSRPVQSWLKNDILVALGLKEDEPRKQVTAHTPVAGLDDQV